MKDSSQARASAEGLRFILFTVVLLLALDVAAARLTPGWKSLTVNVTLVLAVQTAYALWRRDRAILGWLVFGVSAGFAELVADRWLVGTGTLIYPPDEPMIWVSPAYMPLAWAVVLVQVGYIGGWLRDRLSPLKAALATALFAGVNIPFYEHLAKSGDWWHYENTPMLFNAPYYVIVAEFLLALPLALWAGQVVRGRLGRSVALGLVEGVVMLVACFLAFWLVGPCDGALLQLPCR